MSFCDGAAIAGLIPSPAPTIALHPFCLFLFSRLVKKAAPPLAITDALEKLRFFLPPTHTHHEIPLQDSQYRIYLQHTDLSFQWRYPVAVDRVPGSLADSEPAVLYPGAPNLTSREPVPGFGTGREDGFSNLVGTETHPRSPFLDYCLTGIKPGAGWGPVTNVKHNRNRILVFLKIRFWF